jgi:predicted PurR-regulated permease PerM
MKDEYLNKLMTLVIFVVLMVLAFFLVKPILLSIVVGIILAFVLNPIYQWSTKYLRSETLAASLVSLLLLIVIIVPLWFFTPIFIEQSFKFFQSAQELDLVTVFQKFFPSLFASEQFSAEVGQIFQVFISKITNKAVNSFSNLILDFPTLFLQLLVVAFTFFFVLKDQDQLISYVKSLSPFTRDTEDKIFDYSKNITSSVIYGQVIVGIIQGIIAGIGFFIFFLPNALFLTLLASVAGIFPIIGTTIVWLPVSIYLFATGHLFAAVGIFIFGLISSTVDNFLRPMIVSRRTSMHSASILIGMVGGFFLFGVLGLILGPLILAYLLILVEVYRNKKTPGLFIQEPLNIK